MVLSIKISVEDKDTCGQDCPFLNGDECLLFHQHLDKTILPSNHVWQDETKPTRQRDYRCLLATV